MISQDLTALRERLEEMKVAGTLTAPVFDVGMRSLEALTLRVEALEQQLVPSAARHVGDANGKVVALRPRQAAPRPRHYSGGGDAA